MKNKWVAWGAVAAVGVAFGYAGGRARAGIPTNQPMTYSGTLTDANGVALSGTKNIQLILWDQPTLGSSQCSTGPVDVTIGALGSFQLALPNECTTVVHNLPDLWVELIVDNVLVPRSKLGAVPFAVEADHAAKASAASGPLKATVDGLVGRNTRILRAEDERTGCPPAAAVGANLITLQFTLTKPTPVYFTGNMIRMHNGRADITLIVDGVQEANALAISTVAQWEPAELSWAGTLDAGNHSAVIRSGDLAGRNSVADAWGCGPAWGALTALIFE
jgi:hypothetical protein